MRYLQKIESPSFKKHKPASQLSSLIKSKNKSKGTTHELLLQKELERLGLKFRKNVIDLLGKPDIVFDKQHVAIFCDGDFWHGRNWTRQKRRLADGANGSYWSSKISYNIARDKNNSAILKKLGWRVIRIWETDVIRSRQEIAKEIKRLLKNRHSY